MYFGDVALLLSTIFYRSESLYGANCVPFVAEVLANCVD